jgi:Protein of unknown function (DUF669).
MASIDLAKLKEIAGDAPSSSYDVLPAGPYEVEVDRASSEPTQAGKERISVMYKVVSGDNTGRTFWDNMIISPESPKAIQIFLDRLAALGVKNFDGTVELQDVADSLVGARASVVLEHREYKGEVKAQVKSLKPSKAGSISNLVAGPKASALPGSPF